MNGDLDRYDVFYADKLWKLLPEVYRAADSEDDDARGPLRELCDRIGAQMAVVRRGIDRGWEDQSIESCDDWVVPYIADLLATNLVGGADVAEQRREVAKTIYYRRRAGTVSLIEELAHDVTGWDVRVVEFFRRLARTRHAPVDPPVGGDARLLLASGLVGRLTNTPAGGTASLRNVYGDSKRGGAFDEFFYTPDMRRGRGRTGWYNIPHLGIFLWRLYSFPRSAAPWRDLLVTPVTAAAPLPCAGYSTFDPTGREVPLFSTPDHAVNVSSSELSVAAPIARTLLDKLHPVLYAGDGERRSVGVFRTNSNPLLDPDVVALSPGTIWPELGRFRAPSPASTLCVWYHYGFSARIGAGAYDRQQLSAPVPAPAPPLQFRDGAPLTIASKGTVTINDSRTYGVVPDVIGITDLTLRSVSGVRPLIRPAATRGPWVLQGTSGTLRMEGIFTSGVDIILRGDFEEVSIAFSTFDPGQSAGSAWAKAIDGRELQPATLWVEGNVRTMTIDRCITGPVRSRLGGAIESLTIRDSIVQHPTVATPDVLLLQDFVDVEPLAAALRSPSHPVAAALRSILPKTTTSSLDKLKGKKTTKAVAQKVVAGINAALSSPTLFSTSRRAAISSSPAADTATQNRAVIAQAFPLILADLALGLGEGQVAIERSTILGPVSVHRIDVSESILAGIATVDDPQHGCVRFSAWCSGSVLPRKYESVRIPPNAGLFTSSQFGQPAYAQLVTDVDAFVLGDADADAAASIRAGAQNGSEMGAFCTEMAAVKERRLLLKLEEYMPIGLLPVLVHAT